MAEGGEGEGETDSDCGGQGPHYPEVPQIQASTVGGGRTVRANSWVHTPVPWSGVYAGEVAQCSERDGDRRGAQPCPLGITRGEGAKEHQHWRLTLKGHLPTPQQCAQLPPPSPTPSFGQRLTR